MIDRREFWVGRCYFLVTYYDKALSLPSVATYVFLGKNIFGENQGTAHARWYFQTAESFAKDGPFDPKSDASTEDILAIADDVVDDFGDADDLHAELMRNMRGGPKSR